MGFWNVVKIKTEEISKKTAQETTKFVEKTKNSIAITELEDKIKKLYTSIGEQVYAASQENVELPDFSEVFAQIQEYQAQVNQLKEEIDRLKN